MNLSYDYDLITQNLMFIRTKCNSRSEIL